MWTNRSVFLFLPLFLCAGCGQSITQSNDRPLDLVRNAANAASRQCQSFMHEDAGEFTSCVDAVLAQNPGTDMRLNRLGIAYFGWVASNNSARLALPGGESASQKYLALFRPIQRQLAIGDALLCTAVAGNCATRLAQMREQEGPDR